MAEDLKAAYRCGQELVENLGPITAGTLMGALTFCETTAEIIAFVEGVSDRLRGVRR